MRSFLNLFGRSPFMPLQSHMENVARCVHMLPALFEALARGDFGEVEKIATAISDLEHQADITKNNIRDHLPKSLFMPIERGQLLDILSTQDHIANSAEEIAVSVTLKPLTMPEIFVQNFEQFLKKIIECFDGAQLVIRELHELLESSFCGIEAEKVKTMADDVAFKEHESGLILRKLLKSLFSAEKIMDYATFILWERIFEALASIADLSERVATRVRMTLELK
jgi:predicted phosphate transport protein (TIGR00153 family)